MKGKLSNMQNRNPLIKLTLLFAVLLTLGAARAQADVLPGVSIGFAPVGLTMEQTARLNFVNVGEPGGLFINWAFIDADGNVLARSSVTLPLGKTVSFAYCPGCLHDAGQATGGPLPKVRVQVDILNPNVPAKCLSASLEIVDNVTRATTVFMSDAAP
jgi:hypothetical protein